MVKTNGKQKYRYNLKSENIVPHKFAEYIDLNFDNIQVEDPSIFKGKDTFK